MNSLKDLMMAFFAGANGFWGTEFAGNAIRAYMLALFAFLLLAVFFLLLQRGVLIKLESLAKKTKPGADDVIIDTVRHVKPPFYWFVALYTAVKSLALPAIVHRFLDAAIVIAVVIQILAVSGIIIDHLFKKLKNRQTEDGSKTAMDLLAKLTKIAFWAIGILFILSNLGIDITSLIAGLGIGGVAIAFAMQNILADLFCSFAIRFDKPFAVGDFIIVGEHSGTVEKIGIKTTRIRALQGEEIVISNQEMTAARVQNFKQLHERRVAFQLGVEYDTPTAMLKDIPLIMQKILKDTAKTRFDRAHFKTFGNSALIFEVVYHVESDNYDVFMDIQQEINLAVHETFREKGIHIAFPTQTIHVVQ